MRIKEKTLASREVIYGPPPICATCGGEIISHLIKEDGFTYHKDCYDEYIWMLALLKNGRSTRCGGREV